MDDIICIFKRESDADTFFVILNQRHPKIKFTIEKQTENQLTFLDLLITCNGDNFLTSVYRKKLIYLLKKTPVSLHKIIIFLLPECL